MMDVLFEEADWLCSPGTSFAFLGKSHTITFFHQEVEGDAHALRGDRLALLCFFHQGIAGDRHAL